MVVPLKVIYQDEAAIRYVVRNWLDRLELDSLIALQTDCVKDVGAALLSEIGQAAADIVLLVIAKHIQVDIACAIEVLAHARKKGRRVGLIVTTPAAYQVVKQLGFSDEDIVVAFDGQSFDGVLDDLELFVSGGSTLAGNPCYEE